MALPAHYGTGKQTDSGVEYRREDPRAPGYGGVVLHRTRGDVVYRLWSPQKTSEWMPARNVPEALDRVGHHVGVAIMQCQRELIRTETLRRKYPVMCPRCRAAIGSPCSSANSVLSTPHVARVKAMEGAPVPAPKRTSPAKVPAKVSPRAGMPSQYAKAPKPAAVARASNEFGKWLDTFVDEKGLDRDHTFEAEGPKWGSNWIPLQVVIDAAKSASAKEQALIKTTLVKIDFRNGDVMHYFNYLAEALAKQNG